VGLKNHSEIGWVLREYNALIRDAQLQGIKSPETYYNVGKEKGKSSRDRGLEGQKAPDTEKDTSKKFGLTLEGQDLNNVIEERESRHLTHEPVFNEMPPLINKTSATEIPPMLLGFRALKRR